MKEFFFVMSMFVSGQQLPPHIEPAASIEACMARVDETIKKMAEETPDMNGDFRFAAGCLVKSTKADPA